MGSNDDEEKISDDGAADAYDIGYRKPPKHTQFQPGRSGNPKGRRKGMRNLMTDVKRTLKVPVKIKERGRSRNVSTQEGTLMLLREMALSGDPRAIDRLLDFAHRFNNQPSEDAASPSLSASDQAILEAYIAEITWQANDPKTAAPPVDPGSSDDSAQEGPKK